MFALCLQTREISMSPRISPREVFLSLIDGVAAGRWDELPDLYSEDAAVSHPFATDASAKLNGRAQLREHFVGTGKIGLTMRAHDVVVHETADPEVIVAEFAYHGRVGGDGDQFKVPAIFVLRVRDGQIVESRDYLGKRLPLIS
jgi:ketosteroid isomerase-like protein